MSDDFNIDDFLNSNEPYGDDNSDMNGMRERIEKFQNNMQSQTMQEAYRFICEVGILFWIRQDMYVKNNRKLHILDNMIKFFTEIEEYEKCAYLHKGRIALSEIKSETIS